MTSHNTGPSRRTVLVGGLAISGAALLGPAGRAQAANPVDRRWTNPRSQNGWPVLDSFTSVPIEGSALSVPLAGGAAATILTHVARRYHYEVHALHRGDLAGGTSSRTIRAPEQSNYLSGTAISVLPGHYPVGQRGNLFPKELVVIEDMITECDGVVKWGGDLKTPMEGHFQIDLPPTDARVGQLAQRFGHVDTLDSARGAGTIDATDPTRRAKARKFRQRQGR